MAERASGSNSMGNVLRILKRDILRLLKAPAALVVVGALMVLPSLYTWYNVVAFWNPYEATGNLSVSVVNQDAGAKTELTGRLNVGDTVAEELLANDKLNFVEQDFDDAMADLKTGKTYAVYVIPDDFTECLVSPLSGQIKSPQITYYVNEKLGPVSPKITDTAASTLDQTINSMFVTTVSESAAQAIDDAIGDARADESAAQLKATAGVNAAKTSVADVRAKLKDAQAALDGAKSKTETAISTLEGAKSLAVDAKTLANDIAGEASAVQGSLAQASSSTVGSLSNVTAELSVVVGKARTAADGLLAKAGAARTRVDFAAGRIQPLIDTLSGVSQSLQSIASGLPDDSPAKAGIQSAASSLAGHAAQMQSAVDTATALSARIEEIARGVSETAASLDNTTKQVSDALASYSSVLNGSVIPTVSAIVTQVTSVCSTLSVAASDLETTIGEAQVGLRQLGGLLTSSGDAFKQTDTLIAGLQTDVDSIASDIRLLAQSDVISGLVEGGSLNAQNIGEFMGSPTKLETVQMYHPNAYGTAMAPLFMNLTFWIGAFMLVIIFRIEVDEEGIKRITYAQRYLSRFILFAGIAVVQALICCIGVLALGVQVANVPALFIAAAMASLAFLGIIYALSATLQHIGKALCIILVFAQIPGGSGLYPLELTDWFFQAIYPFLPFSYGIDALREAIGGFYGDFFARDIAVLVAICASVTILGVALGPLMSNVTHMASRQIREGDLYNSEDVVVSERPYRLSQVADMLSDEKGFREDLERRYAQFSKLYPVFINASIVLAVGVPVALGLMLALDAGEKVVLLTIVLVWLVALVIFLLVVESLRDNFERQLNLERLAGGGAMSFFFNRNRPATASASLSQYGVRSSGDEAYPGTSGSAVAQAHGETSDGLPAEAFDMPPAEPSGEAPDEPSDEASGESPAEASYESPDDEAHRPQAEGGADA